MVDGDFGGEGGASGGISTGTEDNLFFRFSIVSFRTSSVIKSSSISSRLLSFVSGTRASTKMAAMMQTTQKAKKVPKKKKEANTDTLAMSGKKKD